MIKISVFVVIVTVGIVYNVHGLSPDWPKVCPDIIQRARWGGRTPVAVDYAIIPIKYVVIHHTVTPECYSEQSCSEIMRGIQNFHMETMEFHDVGYNFLVGGDGKIYEGASWHKIGAHTRGYNSRSLGLALIGDFTNKRPSEVQLEAAKKFLACGVELGELANNYTLFGARQVSVTASPGIYLYNAIKQWRHFSNSP